MGVVTLHTKCLDNRAVCVGSVRLAVGMRVSAETIGNFLINTFGAAMFTTVDTSVVKGRVVRAKVASAAVPQRRHDIWSCNQ